MYVLIEERPSGSIVIGYVATLKKAKQRIQELNDNRQKYHQYIAAKIIIEK